MKTTTSTLTTSQAAEYLGLDAGTLNNWRYLGRGPTYVRYSGRAVRYLPADLDAWLAKHRVTPAAT